MGDPPSAPAYAFRPANRALRCCVHSPDGAARRCATPPVNRDDGTLAAIMDRTHQDTVIDRLLISALRGYKRWISPLLGPRCRFHPTCSEYAMQSIARFGALRGSAMAAWRVLRCHPLHPGGHDPVPPRPPKKGDR